jgi:hypothetical protein
MLCPCVIFGDMGLRFFPRSIRFAVIFVLILALSSCTPTSTPTLFVPPTEAPQMIQVIQPTAVSTPTTAPTSPLPTPTSALPCTNNLTFVKDVTIPDGTTVMPNQSLDKQWLVTNSGTCGWDSRYHLKWIGGDAMGAATEQALYPARAGAQATLRIIFTAPSTAGDYQSAWQAAAPDGTMFGDPITIKITVSP